MTYLVPWARPRRPYALPKASGCFRGAVCLGQAASKGNCLLGVGRQQARAPIRKPTERVASLPPRFSAGNHWPYTEKTCRTCVRAAVSKLGRLALPRRKQCVAFLSALRAVIRRPKVPGRCEVALGRDVRDAVFLHGRGLGGRRPRRPGKLTSVKALRGLRFHGKCCTPKLVHAVPGPHYEPARHSRVPFSTGALAMPPARTGKHRVALRRAPFS